MVLCSGPGVLARPGTQQSLGILRKAATEKDTLEVSDKRNEVRGAIEERQAEFEALSKQVETVAINITLRAEADAQVFSLNWRPLYELKISAREGFDVFGESAIPGSAGKPYRAFTYSQQMKATRKMVPPYTIRISQPLLFCVAWFVVHPVHGIMSGTRRCSRL